MCIMLNKEIEYRSLLLVLSLFISCRQDRNENSTWAVYKADAESSSYSPLKQIDTENVHQLQVAWTFTPKDERKDSRSGSSECNPIIIDGVMYATSARHRVYAVHANSGKLIWSYDPFNGGEGGGGGRGGTYLGGGKDKKMFFSAGGGLFFNTLHNTEIIALILS